MTINYPSEIEDLLRLSGQAASIPLDLPVAEAAAVAEIDLAKKYINSGILVYPAIFLAAFVFFYALLNFSSLTAQVSGWFSKPQDEQILGDDLSAYYNWIGGYYFSVGDFTLLEPNNDIDYDGLTNMDEFTIKTNPTLADSDSDSFSDGIEIINGYNPWGAGRMTEVQSKLASSLDLIKVNNRISYNALAVNGSSQVLGVQTVSFDGTKSGVLSIPKLSLRVPIIWSKNPSDFDGDLTRGVIHYPGTAMPGEQGTVYISGHSSDYLWKNHPFRQVFAKINALNAGDDIFVDVFDLSGNVHNFRYKVVSENIYKPDDQAQFIDNSRARLNLSTCWPIGTQKDRYVVSAELMPL
ncbi:MAG: sortase [Candidatus Doudnabacteria bacterium]|nr:sortase [Candidatus Doudnabacteria bacterium]